MGNMGPPSIPLKTGDSQGTMSSYWRIALLNRLRCLIGAEGGCLSFRCNICSRRIVAPLAGIGREIASCRCGSTVRQRSLMHVLTQELFGKSLAIEDIPRRTGLAGVDLSGAQAYVSRMYGRLGYANTFLHKEPRLDITAPGQRWLSSCDYLISSDVFEHVAPPVSRAFDGALRILKPGGVLVLTVPYTKRPCVT